MKFSKLNRIASAIGAEDLTGAVVAIDQALENETGRDWVRALGRLRTFINGAIEHDENGSAYPAPFSFVIARNGNGKLPFLAFSGLPGGAFCPGAGECLKFCYSFRAWRYPFAFARQAQNSVLMISKAGRAAILADLDTAQQKTGARDFRLYVDGDFKTVEEVAFWMDAVNSRPELATYGYSKSWAQLLAYKGAWPSNYMFNLSSGSKHDAATFNKVASLPIARGEFLAVSMGKKVTSNMHGQRAHQKELRAAFMAQTGRKAFTCPGKCGECTPTGHACGSARFAGVPIVIAVH